MTTLSPHADAGRARRLKASTTSTHDSLDSRIMGARIFASRERYAGFLRVQYRFLRDVDALYARADLAALLPDMPARRRLGLVTRDLADLGMAPPAEALPAADAGMAVPGALGWLYVAEGSTLGAAVLYKLAGKLGLDRDFGARHLAAHPEGVAQHWRDFAAALDAVPLAPEQEGEVVSSARAAFVAVRGYVEQELA
ncbi:biliverdin-producing heme oxygenase [Achromobacter sp. Marseille-Q0513]|uniref:biliverdin-producing heme oxygenase n=1 Tax=Achromobacter sp. Marseille-Q0513 TaxID=2829161 RepID=UPI001B9B0ED4|nr:biliverdin-producing heme oxygenase [Achromobacter sp. Marseille-Q0513]MBR8652959.1 biliverdin-producing heme oxygenase [Achromobacter sp. Marseille-Q0513]